MDFELTQLFDFIARYTLALNVLACIVFNLSTLSFAGNKPRLELTSFTPVSFLIISLDLIHRHIEQTVTPLFGVEDYKNVIGLMWYISFAATDLLMVLAAAFIISRMDLRKDRASALILLTYLFMACVQALTFFDTSIAKAYFLYEIYPTLIVSSNVFVSVISCGFALRTALIRLNSKLLFFTRR